MAREMTEIKLPWSSLVEGDQVKSVRNGKFYEVESTAKMMDGYHIKLTGIAKPIMRPTPAEPKAVVRRGATGRAVDVWVDVLSSG
jgi:hypothetical protein